MRGPFLLRPCSNNPKHFQIVSIHKKQQLDEITLEVIEDHIDADNTQTFNEF
jgi:hypothetical protein